MTSSALNQPYIRSAWARAIYNKIQQQNEHQDDQHVYWYAIKQEIVGEELCNMFLQSHQDEETTEFLNHCFEQGTWFFTQLYQDLGKSFLTWFMSATSANALLNRGGMFVMSKAQFESFMNVDADWKWESLLDLGAGNGNVTEKMAPYFHEVFVTELSTPMQWRLQKKGYKLLDAFKWCEEKVDETDELICYKQYDVISCLNLLDRCDHPITLLKQIHSRLKPTGYLLVAMVLPLRQYVEFNQNHKPSEVIPIPKSRSAEIHFKSLVTEFYPSLGFQLVRWTRLPYLCEGDFSQSFYYLSDIVMLFTKCSK